MGVFKKIKKDFTAAARRFAAVATLAGSSLFFPASAQTQQPAPANNNAAGTERAEINAALLRQGQRQFLTLLSSTQSGYSRWLQGLQRELNERLQKSNPDAKLRMVILDPLQMDVGLALGMPPEIVAEMMLQAQGIQNPTPMLIYQSARALTGALYVSVVNDTAYTQVPMTLQTKPDSLGQVVRIVIPMSDYAPIDMIPGLSLQEMARFVDRHEGWHAIDRKNDFSIIDLPPLNADSLQTIKQKIGNVDYLKRACLKYNGEAYADVGAVGDMIRSGAAPDFIDQLIALRMRGKNDVTHMSPPVLRELQKRIGEMGLDKFRALDDQAAEQLYNGVLDKAGLTPARLALVYKYLQCQPEKRLDFVMANRRDPDFSAAFSYINSFVTEEVAEGPRDPSAKSIDPSMLAEVMGINNSLQSWDAKAALQKRAIDIAGKITPESYARAYGSLMNELDSLSQGAPVAEEILLNSKIIKLKKTFLQVIVKTDYVGANKKYGVDILKVEPALQKNLQQRKPLPPPSIKNN
jgi:hypothetical protein